MSDYTELVQRLREQYMDTKQMLPNVLCHDSADAITALQAQVAELITGLHTEQERTHRFLDRAEKAEVERDDFYSDYRMKCDKETKVLHVECDELRAERDALQREMEHLSDMVSACQEVDRTAATIIKSVSEDVAITTPTRDYAGMSPLDCYEAGLLDGGAAVRAHINAAIAKVTG